MSDPQATGTRLDVRALAGALQHIACWQDMSELRSDFYRHATLIMEHLNYDGWVLEQGGRE